MLKLFANINIIQSIIQYTIWNRFQNTEKTENIKNTKKHKTSCPRKKVKNAYLHKFLLEKIITTQQIVHKAMTGIAIGRAFLITVAYKYLHLS